jgi:hypothetical protein
MVHSSYKLQNLTRFACTNNKWCRSCTTTRRACGVAKCVGAVSTQSACSCTCNGTPRLFIARVGRLTLAAFLVRDVAQLLCTRPLTPYFTCLQSPQRRERNVLQDSAMVPFAPTSPPSYAHSAYMHCNPLTPLPPGSSNATTLRLDQT